VLLRISIILLIIFASLPITAPFILNYSYIDPSDTEKVHIDINPLVVYYMHTRLDSRLSYEDEFNNNIELNKFTSTENERLYHKTIAKVQDNIFLIQTEWAWLWGDYRYGFFLVKIKDGILELLDSHITESSSSPIHLYKINEDKVTIKFEHEILNLYI
tara:strand:- start:161 stop:637 length:477 start_codon:yes stop_codon:yes gene_type:complete